MDTFLVGQIAFWWSKYAVRCEWFLVGDEDDVVTNRIEKIKITLANTNKQTNKQTPHDSYYSRKKNDNLIHFGFCFCFMWLFIIIFIHFSTMTDQTFGCREQNYWDCRWSSRPSSQRKGRTKRTQLVRPFRMYGAFVVCCCCCNLISLLVVRMRFLSAMLCYHALNIPN